MASIGLHENVDDPPARVGFKDIAWSWNSMEAQICRRACTPRRKGCYGIGHKSKCTGAVRLFVMHKQACQFDGGCCLLAPEMLLPLEDTTKSRETIVSWPAKFSPQGVKSAAQ